MPSVCLDTCLAGQTGPCRFEVSELTICSAVVSGDCPSEHTKCDYASDLVEVARCELGVATLNDLLTLYAAHGYAGRGS